MSASSVIISLAFSLVFISPAILGIVALLTKEGVAEVPKTKGDMPNYKAQHENYWRGYLDQ